jgi:multimeric flavodoxin WrbA
MKIVLVLGSPRSSSDSSLIAEAAADAFPGEDKSISKYVLNDFSGKGCQACFGCKDKEEGCVIEDDISPVLAAAKEADLLVVASPIYIGDVTAQLKVFIDRTYSWCKPGFPHKSDGSQEKPSKKALLVYTQGNPDPKAYLSYVVRRYHDHFEKYGFAVDALVVPISPKGGDHDQMLSEAKKEAAKLAASL